MNYPSENQRKSLLPLLLLLCMIPLLSGCGIIGVIGEAFASDDVEDPKFETDEKTLLVIPFRDDIFPHYESERGKLLSSAVVRNIIKNHDYTYLERVFEDDKLEKFFTFNQEVPWERINTNVKADLILIGGIESFQTSRPGDVGLRRGSARAYIQVYDTKLKQVIFKKKVAATYPKTTTRSVYVKDAYTVEAGLLGELAYKIGREFYSYTKKPSYDNF